jgi:hypothetical protein
MEAERDRAEERGKYEGGDDGSSRLRGGQAATGARA